MCSFTSLISSVSAPKFEEACAARRTTACFRLGVLYPDLFSVTAPLIGLATEDGEDPVLELEGLFDDPYRASDAARAQAGSSMSQSIPIVAARIPTSAHTIIAAKLARLERETAELAELARAKRDSHG